MFVRVALIVALCGPIGLRIARGSVACDVVVDCGHMYFTPSRHAG